MSTSPAIASFTGLCAVADATSEAITAKPSSGGGGGGQTAANLPPRERLPREACLRRAREPPIRPGRRESGIDPWPQAPPQRRRAATWDEGLSWGTSLQNGAFGADNPYIQGIEPPRPFRRCVRENVTNVVSDHRRATHAIVGPRGVRLALSVGQPDDDRHTRHLAQDGHGYPQTPGYRGAHPPDPE